MKIIRVFVGIILVGAIIYCVSDVSAQKRPRQVMGCEENFAKLDTDKDGKISLKEFMAVAKDKDRAEELFKSIDSDKDGFLIKEEFCSKKGTRQGKKRAN